MSSLFWLNEVQMAKIKPYLPLSRGFRRADDRRVLSGIIYVIKRGLHWSDAPKEYGSHKTLYNRFARWSKRGVFTRLFAGLATELDLPKTLMMDSTYLKAHRTASSLAQKKTKIAVSDVQKAV